MLGQAWLPSRDSFHFECPLSFGKSDEENNPGIIYVTLKIDFPKMFPTALTRRIVLQQLMSIYDPLGLLAPFVLLGKLLMRDTWDKRLKKLDDDEQSLGWDDNLPLTLFNPWRHFFYKAYEMEEFEVPRSVMPENAIGNP